MKSEINIYENKGVFLNFKIISVVAYIDITLNNELIIDGKVNNNIIK